MRIGLAAVLATLAPVAAQAATQSVVEQASYALGDNDTRAQAREICLAKAERKALEASGALVESELDMISTETGGAVNDQAHQHVRSYVGAVVTATGTRDTFRLDGERMVVDCAATVTFNPDEVRDRLRMARADNTTKIKVDEQQSRIAALEAEVQELKAKLAQQTQVQAQAQLQAQAPHTLQPLAQAAPALAPPTPGDLSAPPMPQAQPRPEVLQHPLPPPGTEEPQQPEVQAANPPPPAPPESRPAGPIVVWRPALQPQYASAGWGGFAARARFIRPGMTEADLVALMGNPRSSIHEYWRVYSWNYGRIWVTMNGGMVQCVSLREAPNCRWFSALR